MRQPAAVGTMAAWGQPSAAPPRHPVLPLSLMLPMLPMLPMPHALPDVPDLPVLRPCPKSN